MRKAPVKVEVKQVAPPVPTAAPERTGSFLLETSRDCSVVGALKDVLHSPGEPLAPKRRDYMEPRFGRNFSQVRVHEGANADASARHLGARAFSVGHHIVLSNVSHLTESLESRCILAHELAHSVQQTGLTVPSSGILEVGPENDNFEREARTCARSTSLISGASGRLARARIQRISFSETLNRFFGAEGAFDDAELQAYLRFLDRLNRIEDHFDSDNKARAVARRWRANRPGYDLSVRRKVLLLREMISGFTGDEDEEQMLSLLTASTDTELSQIFVHVPPDEMRGEIHGEERTRFDVLMTRYYSRVGHRSDALAGTAPATPTQHLLTESVLNPGSTLQLSAPPSSPGQATPPPVLQGPPAMTGLPPSPGVEGAYERDMRTAILAYLHTTAERFRQRQQAGPPSFPISQANSIAVEAQQATENYFRPYISVASRLPSSPYHPGSYSLTSRFTINRKCLLRTTGTTDIPVESAGYVIGCARISAAGQP